MKTVKSKKHSTKKKTAALLKNARALLSLTLGLLSVEQSPAYAADIVPDKSAPANVRPVVSVSSTGIPVVLIANPNAAGLSHNVFNKFSVSQNGVIFDNSTSTTGTMLGATVVANPFLSAPAKVILTEVNGGTPTALNGYVEVAGQKADLVIANPFGITVNGAAFLNAGGVTLTTGKPQFTSAGTIQGYLVTNGQVGIGEKGVNASNLDYFDTISRTAQLNGPLYAKNAQVILGQNTVDAATLAATAAGTNTAVVTPAPPVALDVGAQGSIYGGTVYLISTEKGVGVNNAGVIQGEQKLNISADGKITLAGHTVSGADLDIKGGALDNSGTTYAQGNTTVQAGAAVDNSGVLASGKDTQITAGTINSSGTLAAGLWTDGQLNTDGQGKLATVATQSALTGLTVSAGDQRHQATQMTLGGQVAASGNLDLNASGLTNSGRVTAAHNATVTTSTLQSTGTVAAGEQLTVKADSIDAAGGTLYGTTTSVQAQQIQNSGTIIGQQTAQVTADNIHIDQTGGVLAGQNAAVHVNQDLNSEGQISALSVALQAATVEQAGTVTANTLDFSTRHLNNSGTINSAADFGLNLTDLTNSGSIISNGVLTVQTGHLYGEGGTLYSANTTVNADHIESAGTVIGQNGVTVNTGDLSISQTGGLSSAGAITAQVSGKLQSAGQIAGQDVQLKAGSVENSGQLQSSALTVQTGHLANSGVMTATGDATINSTDLTNSGTLAAGQVLNLTTGTVIGEGGTLSSKSTTIKAADISSSGTLIGTDALNIAADHLNIDAHGGALSNGDIQFGIKGNLENAGQISGQNLDFSAQQLTNTGTVAGKGVNFQVAVFKNSGEIAAVENIRLNAQDTQNSGKLSAGQNLDVTTQTLEGAGGSLYANAATIKAGTVASTGLIAAQNNVNLTADKVTVDQAGGVAAGQQVQFNVADSVDNAGQIQGQQVQFTTAALRNTGEVQAGKLGIRSTSLDNQGRLKAAQDASVQVQSLVNSGVLAAGGHLDVSTGALTGQGGTLYGNTTSIKAADISSTGTIVGQQSADLSAHSLTVDGAGSVASGGALKVKVDGDLTNAGTVQGSDVQLQAQQLTNSGQIQAGQGVIQASVLNNSGQITSANDLTITNDVTNNSGTVAAGGALSLTTGVLNGHGGTLYGNTTSLKAGTIHSLGKLMSQQDMQFQVSDLTIGAEDGLASGGTIKLDVSGALRNAGLLQGQDVNVTAGTLENSGQLVAGHNAALQAASTTNTGTIAANNALSLTTGTLDNTAGTLYGVSTTLSADNVTHSGSVIGQQALNVKAGTVQVAAGEQLASGGVANVAVSGTLNNAGQIQGQQVNLRTDTAQNTGTVQAEDLVFKTRVLTNSGALTASHSATIDGGTAQNSGTVAAGEGLQFTVASLDNTAGTLYGQSTSLKAGDITATGTIIGQNLLQVAANSLNVQQGEQLAAGTQAKIDIAGDLKNAGSVSAQDLQLMAGSLKNAGTVQGTTVDVKAQSLTNTGELTAAQRATLQAGALTNTGTVAAAGDLSVTAKTLEGASGTLYGNAVTVNAQHLNSVGTLVGQQSVNLNAGDVHIESAGVVSAGQEAQFTVSGALSNAGQLAGQHLTFQVGDLNNAGQIQAGNLDLQSTSLTNSGSMTAAQQANVQGQNVTNTGTLVAGDRLALKADTLAGQGGTIQSQATSIAAGTISSTGVITGGQSLDVAAQNLTVDVRGVLGSNGQTTIKADQQLANAGVITGPAVQLTAGTADNSGQVQADNLTFTVQTLKNSGQISAVQNLTLTPANLTNSGTIASNGALGITATTLNGAGGTLSGKTVTMQAGDVVSSGNLLAQDTLKVSGGNLSVGAGETLASGGQTQLALTGQLKNAGSIAGQDVDIAAGDTTNSGTVQGNTATFKVTALNNSGSLTAAQQLGVFTTSLSNTGTVAAGDSLVVKADSLDNQAVLYGKSNTLQFKQLSNSGQISGDTNLTLSGEDATFSSSSVLASNGLTAVNVSGTLNNQGQLSGQDITLAAGTLSNTAQDKSVATQGLISAAHDLTVTAGGLSGNGNYVAGNALKFNTQDFSIAEGGTAYSQFTTLKTNQAQVLGTLYGQSNLDVQADTLHSSGVISSAGSANLQTTGELQNSGTIGATDLTVGAQTLSNTGTLQGNTVQVKADTLNNSAQSGVTGTGQVVSAGALTVTTQNLNNTAGGLIAGNGLTTINTQVLNNAGGNIYGATMSLNAPQITALGSITADQLDFATDTDYDVDGTLSAQKSITFHVKNTLTNRGTISADTVSATAGTLNNQGTLLANTLQVDTGTLNNSGKMSATQTATVHTSDLTNTGSIASDGVLDVTAHTLTNTGGLLYAGQQGSVTTGTLTGDGNIHGAQDFSVKVTNAFTNTAAGELRAGRLLTLELPGGFTNQGKVEAGVVKLTTGALDNQQTINGGLLDIQADSVKNTVTLSGGDVSLKAGSVVNDGAQALIIGTNSLNITTTGDGSTPDLLNNNGATLYSGGDMSLSSGYIRNFSSLIEAEGNMDIEAGKLENTRTVNVSSIVSTNTVVNPIYTAYYPRPSYEQWYMKKYIPKFENIYASDIAITTTTTDKIIDETPESKILSGNRMIINSDTRNFASVISSASDMYINGIVNPNVDTITNGLINTPVNLKENSTTDGKKSFVMMESDCVGTVILGRCWLWNYEDHLVTVDQPYVIAQPEKTIGTRTATISGRNNVVIGGKTVQNGTAPTEDVSAPTNADSPVKVAGAGTPVGVPDGTNTGAIPAPGTALVEAPKIDSASGAQQLHQDAQTQNPNAPQARNVSGAQAPDQKTIKGGQAPEKRATTLPLDSSKQTATVPGQPGAVNTAAPSQVDLKLPDGKNASGSATGVDTKSGATPTAQEAERPLAVSQPDFSITIPLNAMYKVNQAPDLPLVTTSDMVKGDFDYVDSRNYFPGETARHIGDGYYEQKLVRDQLLMLQGYNYDRSSLNSYYQEMLQNGSEFAKAAGVQSGTELTQAQQQALTKDIVVLVSRSVQTPTGPQTVLVPTVYLAPGSVRPTGSTIMAGKDLTMQLSGKLVNTGTLQGANVGVEAANIENFKGTINADQQVYLKSLLDITNASGTIAGGTGVYLNAARDVNNITLSHQIKAPGAVTTVFDPAALITSGAGNVVINAGHNINFQAGQVTTGLGNISLTAGNNINLFDARKIQSQLSSNGESRSLDFSVGSALVSGGAMSVQAGNALTTIGAGLQSVGDLTLRGKTVNLLEGRNLTSETQNINLTTSGFLHSTTVSGTFATTTNSGSATSLMGKNVSVISQDDLNSRGTVINATAGNALLQSVNGRVNAGALQNITTIDESLKQSTSGLTFGGGLSLHLGTNSNDTTTHTVVTQNQKGTIASPTGNVVLDGAKGVDRAGVDIIAPKGQVLLDGHGYGVNEAELHDTVATTSQTKTKDTGLTVGVSSPKLDLLADSASALSRLTGIGKSPASGPDLGNFGVATPMGEVDQLPDLFQPATPSTTPATTSAAATQPGLSSNMQIALGTHLLRNAVDFSQATKQQAQADEALSEAKADGDDAKSLKNPGALTFKVGFGSSESTTNTNSLQSTSVGNATVAQKVIYNNNMADGSKPVGDIVLTGSTINGADANGAATKADQVVFNTTGNAYLRSGTSTTATTTTSSSSGWNVGVSASSNGFAGVTLDANKGSSSSEVHSLTNTNTAIDTNNLVVKADTFNMTGATVNTVNADVDVNNLVVRSAQDTGSITSKSNQMNGGIAVGPKSFNVSAGASQTNGNGTYKAVEQQTALNVTGNYNIKTHQTTVNGAAINTDPSKGTLTTDPGGLHIGDLQNSSNYTTRTIGGNISLGTNGISGAPAIGGKDLKSADITRGSVTATVNGTAVTATNPTQNSSLKLPEFLNAPTKAADLSEAGSMFSKDIYKTVGDIGVKYNLQDGSAAKVALHAGAGALTALVGGDNVLSSAAAAGTNEALLPVMKTALGGEAVTPQQKALQDSMLKTGSALIGAGVGAATGGNAFGIGNITQSATENNYLKHIELLDYAKQLNACQDIKDLNKRDACVNEAKGKWDALSKKRDDALMENCVISKNSEKCNRLTEEAKATDREYAKEFSDGRFGVYVNKILGWSNGGPGELYLDNSPIAALQNVSDAKKALKKIQVERQDVGLDKTTNLYINKITYNIINDKNLTIKDKSILLQSVSNDVTAINGIRNGGPSPLKGVGASIEAVFMAADGNIGEYAKLSGALNTRIGAAVDLSGNSAQLANGIAGEAFGRVANIASAKTISSLGRIANSLKGGDVETGPSVKNKSLTQQDGNPCPNSFAPLTLVWTNLGLRPIIEIRPGDQVLAYNESLSQNGYYPVTAVHRNMDPALTYLWVKSNTTGAKEMITTTPEHPFYLAGNVDGSTRPAPIGHEDLSARWVGAGHLKDGDRLRMADGTQGTVVNVKTEQETREMFNLTVDTAHTFYVGANGWLVHNSSSSFANSPNWGSHSMLDSLKAIGADLSNYTFNANRSKILYPNADGTKQVVYDVVDGYYRVQDLTHPKASSNAELSYLDQYGKPIPPNVKVWKPGKNGRPGKWVETGIGDIRKAFTHFIDDSGPCAF